MIIAITGYRRCGKDYLATELEKYYNYDLNVKKYAFAKPIKKYISNLTGLSIKDIDKYKKKNKKFKILNKKYNIRQLLIKFANTLKDLTDDKIWAQAIINEFIKDNVDIKIITDLRFLHEYQALKKYSKGTEALFIIKLNSDLKNCDKNNKDETEIEKIPYHYEFHNTKKGFKKEFNKLLKFLRSPQFTYMILANN